MVFYIYFEYISISISVYRDRDRERETIIETERERDRERVQNRPPQDMPLWHLDYFKLKAVETQGKLLPFP